MAEEKRVLNLDEVFGQDRPVKVIWNQREYELLRLEAFSPKEIQKFSALQARAQKLSATPSQHPPNAESANLGEEQEREISALFDEMLRALCSELPLDSMPFLAKTRIITFYIEETQGKKALEEALMKQPIGATS